MLEISYTMMINLYKSNKKEEDGPIPDEWIPSEDKLEEVFDSIFEDFQEAVFKAASKCTKEEFLESLKEENKQWL